LISILILMNSELQISELLHAVDYSENSGRGIAELWTSGSALRKNSGCGIADQH
jgi:hypothetical protein